MGNPLETLVRDLNEKLEKARKAYYVDAAPIMDDAEYDTLEGQLKGVVDANPDLAPLATALTTVGSDTTTAKGTNGRIKHVRPMLSIENKYTKDDVVAFVLDLPYPKGSVIVDVEPKRDGISCELTYIDGKLTQAVTRGTGSEGEDMTAQVMALKSIPKSFTATGVADENGYGIPRELRVRGELVMRDGELDRINAEATAKGQKTYASTRNLTAGTMKQRDLSVVASRNIEFMPWDVYSPTQDSLLPFGNINRMNTLSTLGFAKYEGVAVQNPDDIIKAIDQILELNAKSDIRADGVVIKVDDVSVRKQLGVASKFTNWMTCFKPQSASGTTYLRTITWQVGRQGALTPVATCDPVILAGASVTRATLNNITWIQTLGLTIGAKVEMLRSGDVIPQIVKVLDDTGDPIVPPTTCPECGKAITEWTDKNSSVTSHFCENAECPARVRGTLSYIGSRDILEIDGLADDMANRLATNGYARNIAELFEFQVEATNSLKMLKDKYGDEPGEGQFVTRMAKQGFSVIVVKMLKSMESAKTTRWDKWIPALSIPFVGRTMGKLLAKELKLEADDMPNLCAKLEDAANRGIAGLGEVKADILRKWALDPVNRDICVSLFNSGVRPTPTVAKAAAGVGQPLAGVSFCITGEFDEDREKITAKLESLGAVAKSGVSKNITHLIVGEGAGKSKLAKYDELAATGKYNIQKVGKQWLADTLEAAGMSMKTLFAVEEV